jgi:hypothetical protein
MVLEFLARGIRDKSNTNWKGSSQTITTCRWYDLIPKKKKWKLLDIISSFSKVAGPKSIYKNQ